MGHGFLNLRLFAALSLREGLDCAVCVGAVCVGAEVFVLVGSAATTSYVAETVSKMVLLPGVTFWTCQISLSVADVTF